MINYNLYIRNFGPYISSHGPFPLKQFTWFTGENGSGKTAILDAIKTLLFCDENYIMYNPDGENRNQREYVNTFSKSKFGPTILAMHVLFPKTEKKTEKRFFIGMVCDKSLNWRYFVKEEIELDQTKELVNNALDTRRFFNELAENIPGVLKNFKKVDEYHEFLSNEEIMFFPNPLSKNDEYIDFLKLNKLSTELFAGKSKLQLEKIKENLFKNSINPDLMSSILKKLEEGRFQMETFSNERNKNKEKLKSLDELIETYKKYYLDGVLKNIYLDVLILKENLVNIENSFNILITEINDINAQVLTDESIIENDEKNNILIEGKLRYLEEFDFKLSNIFQFYETYKEKYLLKDKEYFEGQLKAIEDKIDKLKSDIRKKTTSVEIKKSKILTNKKSIDRLKSEFEIYDNKKLKLEKEKFSIETSKEKIRENIIIIENYKNKIIETNSEIERLWSELESLDQLEEYQSILNKILYKQIFELESSIKQIELENIHFTNANNENKGEIEKLIQLTINNQFVEIKNNYNIKQVIDYFQELKIEDASLFEPIIKNYYDYLVLSFEKKKLIEEISSEFNKVNLEVPGFIILDEGETEFLIDLPQKIDEEYSLGWFIEDKIAHYSKAENKILLSSKNRNEKINEYKLKIANNNEKYNKNQIVVELISDKVKKIKNFNQFNNFEKKRIESKFGKNINGVFNQFTIDFNELSKDLKEKETNLIQFIADNKNVEHLLKNLELENTELIKEMDDIKDDINQKKAELQENETKLDEIDSDLITFEEKTNIYLSIYSEFEGIITEIKSNYFNFPYIVKNIVEDISVEKQIKKLTNQEINKHNKELNVNSNQINQLKDKIERSKREKSIKENAIKTLKENSIEHENTIVNLENNIKSIFERKLIIDINLFSNFEENFSDWENSLINDVNKEFLSSNLDKKEFYQTKKNEIKYSTNQIFENLISQIIPEVLNKFQRPQIGTFIDKSNLIDLNSLKNYLDLNVNNLEIKKYFNEKSAYIESQLLSLSDWFLGNLEEFVDIVQSHVKEVRKKTRRLNEISKFANFGKLGSINFDIKTNKNYDDLLKFKNNLFTSKEEGTLNSSILSKISPKENFGDSLAKIIFEDNSKNEQDLTNFYGYYTFDIESHRPNGQVIRATKGSTGESIGLKFLIFSFILDSFKANLMTLNINKNNLFLFIDEAAKLDNKGINSIVEIAKLLNIFVIFAKKEISEFIQSDQIFYMVDSGVIVPYEGSNFINEIWMKDD